MYIPIFDSDLVSIPIANENIFDDMIDACFFSHAVDSVSLFESVMPEIDGASIPSERIFSIYDFELATIDQESNINPLAKRLFALINEIDSYYVPAPLFVSSLITVSKHHLSPFLASAGNFTCWNDTSIGLRNENGVYNTDVYENASIPFGLERRAEETDFDSRVADDIPNAQPSNVANNVNV